MDKNSIFKLCYFDTARRKTLYTWWGPYQLSGASAHVKIFPYSEFLSLQYVANPIMQCNATSWWDIYTVEVMNSDVNATFYIELVNYLGHVSVE